MSFRRVNKVQRELEARILPRCLPANPSYSMPRQSTEALIRVEVGTRFANFISEIFHGQ
jgi:hypothetical protein